jgi:catechol 2,3-dioxygenase-like lactoylglutathione lyase family enzyme
MPHAEGMRQGVQIITVAAKDLAVSRAFYSDGLGWRSTLDLPEIVYYQVGHGLLFALFPLLDFAGDVGAPITSESGFSLGYVVDTPADVEFEIERARSAGAEILKDAQDAAFGGYHGYFADPDGHRWEVAWNPTFAVADDGRVSIA